MRIGNQNGPPIIIFWQRLLDSGLSKARLHLPVVTVLFIAATFKTHELASSPSTSNLVLNSRTASTVLVLAEYSAGFWLLSRFGAGISRLVGISLFFFFLVGSIARYLDGNPSCGCFGQIEIHPAVTIVLNLLMIGCLSVWTSNTKSHSKPILLISLFATVLTIAISAIVSFDPAELSAAGEVLGDGRTVVISGTNWVGNKFPVVGYVSSAHSLFDPNSLLDGNWDVVFYHEDCEKCQQIMASAESIRPETAVVFVEVPPFKSPARLDTAKKKWLRLSSDKYWFVETPLIVTITAGLVETVTERNLSSKN